MPFIYVFYAYEGVYIMSDIHTEIDKLLYPKKEEEVKEVKVEVKQEKEEDEPILDTIQEQIESPMTTIHSPESVKEGELKLINKNPENYIEINFIKKIRIVDSFYIHSNIKRFNYGKVVYNIVEENIYILPTKKGYFIPTCFYKEDKPDPIDYINKNEGITGKALSLLYDVKLYIDLFAGEEGKYNLFVVVMLIISISSFIIGLYFVLGGGV